MNCFSIEKQNELISEIVGNIHNEDFVVDNTVSIITGMVEKSKSIDEMSACLIEKGASRKLSEEMSEVILKFEKVNKKFQNKMMIILALNYKHE